MNVIYRSYNCQNSLVAYLEIIFSCNVTNSFRFNIYSSGAIKYFRETECKKMLSRFDTMEVHIVLCTFT